MQSASDPGDRQLLTFGARATIRMVRCFTGRVAMQASV